MNLYLEIQAKEVDWYKANGLFNRLRIDSKGNIYVIGDWSWNQMHPYQQEYIENRMKHEVYDKFSI